jgi:hypothetical protein
VCTFQTELSKVYRQYQAFFILVILVSLLGFASVGLEKFNLQHVSK